MKEVNIFFRNTQKQRNRILTESRGNGLILIREYKGNASMYEGHFSRKSEKWISWDEFTDLLTVRIIPSFFHVISEPRTLRL